MQTRSNPARPPELPPEAVAAMRAGRKIEAIKIVREHTGLGLAEAKALVEGRTPRIPARHPTGARNDNGALRVLLTIAVLGALAALFLF